MMRAVKYCGGCNPCYDRRAAVRALEERLGEPLPPARPGVDYDELFIICGCPAQCAGISGLSARRLVWVLSMPT